MIVEEFLKLPPWVHYQGIEFKFQIINDGGNELRLGYIIASVGHGSQHALYYNEWGCWSNTLADPINPPSQGFLILFENITSDIDLIWAARQCWFQLQEWGLLRD